MGTTMIFALLVILTDVTLQVVSQVPQISLLGSPVSSAGQYSSVLDSTSRLHIFFQPLPDEAVVFAFVGYFVETTNISFLIWHNATVNDTQGFEVVFRYDYTPSITDLYRRQVVRLENNACFLTQKDDYFGLFGRGPFALGYKVSAPVSQWAITTVADPPPTGYSVSNPSLLAYPFEYALQIAIDENVSAYNLSNITCRPSSIMIVPDEPAGTTAQAPLQGEKGQKGDPGLPGTPGAKGDTGQKGEPAVPANVASAVQNGDCKCAETLLNQWVILGLIVWLVLLTLILVIVVVIVTIRRNEYLSKPVTLHNYQRNNPWFTDSRAEQWNSSQSDRLTDRSS